MKTILLSLILISLLSNRSFAAETILEVIPLSNRLASEIQPLLSPLLEITDQVIADGSNLIVKTTPDRLAEIKSLINKLDIRQNNLIITVIQSRQTTADELNAAARIQLNIPADKLSKSSGQMLGHVYQTQNKNANENTQTIRTMEGSTAYIKAGGSYPTQNIQIYNSGSGNTYPKKDIVTYNSDLGSTFPAQTVQTYDAESGNTFPAQTFQTDDSQSVQTDNSNSGSANTPQNVPANTLYPAISTTTKYIDATTGFAVTPRLAGQQVILAISPWSDKMNTQGQIQTQDAQSTVRVNLGEWIELGGIGENSNNRTNSNLSTIRQTSKNQLHILVKVDKVD